MMPSFGDWVRRTATVIEEFRMIPGHDPHVWPALTKELA